MTKSPYAENYKRSAASSGDRQVRNRSWWEQLPMTYEAWEASSRLPTGRVDFERINRAYLESNPWLADNLDFGALAKAGVLEIGCGAGTAACLFAKAGASVTAIDLTERAVQMTRENARAQGFDSVQVLRMDAERMEFPNAAFDFVYSWGVIHHSSQPELAVAQIGRVLRPGGDGLVMVYNRRSLRYWLKGIYWLLLKGKLLTGESISSVQRYFTDGFFHRHYTAAEFRRLLQAHDLKTTTVSVTHMSKQMIPIVPRKLDEYLKRHWGWLLVVRFHKPERPA